MGTNREDNYYQQLLTFEICFHYNYDYVIQLFWCETSLEVQSDYALSLEDHVAMYFINLVTSI